MYYNTLRLLCVYISFSVLHHTLLFLTLLVYMYDYCCLWQDEDQDDVEKHLDMPPSWVETLSLTLKEYQTRCPQGKKSVLYKRAKLEKCAHYLNRDGLITKLSIYHDKDCK